MLSPRLLRCSAVGLSCFAAVVLGLATLAVSHPGSLDDATIVLVYARHLAQGGGIYWNRSEGHVDGYTSFLDMILKAGATSVWRGDPLGVAHCLSIAFFVVSILAGAAIAFRSARRLGGPGLAIPALGTLAFGANASLAYGTSYLLETSLYASVALVGLYLLSFAPLERAHYRAALAASWVLLVLVRPEGGPVAVVQAAMFVWRYRRRLTLGSLAAPCLALAGVTVVYYVWHLAYFGWLAPNTYYAKASDSRWLEIKDGADYVTAHLREDRSSCLLAALPACVLVRRVWSDERGRFCAAVATASALVAIAEVVLSGGDSYSGGRFLVVPLAYLSAVAVMGAAEMRPAWRVLALAPLAVVVYDAAEALSWRPQAARERLASWPISTRNFQCSIDAVTTLARHIESLAQTDWQNIKLFHDELRIIDLTGINNQAIAHTKWPGQSLWGKANISPATIREGADVLLLGPEMDPSAPLTRYSTEEVVTSDALSAHHMGFSLAREVQLVIVEHYLPLSVPVCGGYFNVFLRKELAGRFAREDVLLGVSVSPK